ncbi:MAG TPA: Rieske 2Fe-2S domain-containing protein [Pyrinomonadaceae bacterium]|nr:Rieske 2Fe-2S domain-containing protein [Pyrinomonadaceae bacterium]
MNNQPDSQTATQDPNRSGRRSFVGLLVGLIWTTITGAIGAIAARFVATPAPGEELTSSWTEIGVLNEIPDGKPTKHEVTVERDSGWARFKSSRSVWVVRKDRSATVFSAVCPHLGCTIDASADGFVCPCHGSSWGAYGDKLAGPTPRGLDVLESRIDGDALKVKYQDFKQGSPQKELAQ